MLTFNHLKKNLKKPADDCKVIRLALLADSASQFITQALKGYGIEYKIDYKIFEADYNQIDRQVFDPSSELYSYEPDFIIIIRSSERLLKSFYKKNATEKNSFAEDEMAYINSLYSAISHQLKAKVIANTYIEINDGIFGNYATKTTLSFLYQVKKLNLLLMDNSRGLKNLFLFDLSALINTKGYNNTFDPKMYVNADMVFGIDILPDMAKSLHGIIQAVTGAFKKCIILDLDNTLWGGIIGDDGMEGIHIGELGIGKAFTELQLWIRELIRRGIIVAVCSKNSEGIAKEPFMNHPDMVLRLEDIAVFVANWENKVDSIKHIQSVLNIGFDSMVFLDDNPFEREMVAQAIPDITIPPLPEDPAEYLPYLRSLNLFETASITEEDETRTKQYQEEAKRSVLQQSFANEDEFLQNLSMESEVGPLNRFSIPRAAQLSLRSNQFNLRTIRYTEQEIEKIVADKQNYVTISFNLRDKFGDHGLISMVILKKENDGLFIDTWIMSCRVLKRGMENFVLNSIAEIAIENGIKKIKGEYLPTKKNNIVKGHYKDLGFVKDGQHFILNLSDYILKKNFIKKVNT